MSAILLLGLAAIAGPANTAEAGTLHCGDLITKNVVLQQSLTCAGNALRVQVPEGKTVHIDLNGHQLKGNGTAAGIGPTSPFDYRSGDLIVSDGTITGFASAFFEVGTYDRAVQNLTIRNLRMISNGVWLYTRNSPRTVIEESTFIDTGHGGGGMDYRSLTVRDSKFVRSEIRAPSQSYNTLTGNTFVESGFRAGPFSNVIATGNTFRGCDTAILIPELWFAGTTTVEDNQFIRCNVGVNFTGMSGPVSVQRNKFIENALAGMMFSRPQSRLTLTIADNMFRRNGGDGLTGGGPQHGGGDTPPSTTISGNLAIGNTGHGINVANVTDGGGNVGRSNGTLPDCVGVTCTEH